MSVFLGVVGACGATLGVGGMAVGALLWRLSRPMTADEIEEMRRAHWAYTRAHYPDVYWSDAPTASMAEDAPANDGLHSLRADRIERGDWDSGRALAG